jgi:hypothetical protein
MVRVRRPAAALLVLLAAPASAQTPTPCGPGGAFPDVPQSHPFCAWVQQLTQDQIAGSCDGTNYCPDAPVTRAQLALFLGRLTRGTPSSMVDADTVDGLDSSAFLLIAGGTMAGGVDMQNNLVVNVGNAGTDFLAGGGLNVAGNFAVAGNAALGDASSDTLSVGATLQGATPLVFEGGAVDAAQTSLQVTNPTVDRTITLPNATGEVSLLGQTIDSAEITDGTIAFADLGANGCANTNVIQRSGSAWVCGSASTPTVFVHTVTNLNTVAPYTILDHPSVNNSSTVKLFVTLDNTNGAGPNAVVGVRRIDLGPPIGIRWVIEMMNGGTPPLNATFNVLVMP